MRDSQTLQITEVRSNNGNLQAAIFFNKSVT